MHLCNSTLKDFNSNLGMVFHSLEDPIDRTTMSKQVGDDENYEFAVFQKHHQIPFLAGLTQFQDQ
jgi:hypothetical protein